MYDGQPHNFVTGELQIRFNQMNISNLKKIGSPIFAPRSIFPAALRE